MITKNISGPAVTGVNHIDTSDATRFQANLDKALRSINILLPEGKRMERLELVSVESSDKDRAFGVKGDAYFYGGKIYLPEGADGASEVQHEAIHLIQEFLRFTDKTWDWCVKNYMNAEAAGENAHASENMRMLRGERTGKKDRTATVYHAMIEAGAYYPMFVEDALGGISQHTAWKDPDAIGKVATCMMGALGAYYNEKNDLRKIGFGYLPGIKDIRTGAYLDKTADLLLAILKDLPADLVEAGPVALSSKRNTASMHLGVAISLWTLIATNDIRKTFDTLLSSPEAILETISCMDGKEFGKLIRYRKTAEHIIDRTIEQKSVGGQAESKA